MKAVFILATLDTKGQEAAFVRDRLTALGVSTRLVDVGSFGAPAVPADISREVVFAAAGTTAAAVRARGDRGAAVTEAATGARQLILDRHRQDEVAGLLALGGSAGTIIGTEAMRALPIGVPKLMVSTLAAGQVRQYVGEKEILMMNAVVDISGLNRISRQVLATAAEAMAGMVIFGAGHGATTGDQRPLVALTMFGVTTPCVEQARVVIEEGGYETLVLHATGTGGRVLESLARQGMLAGILDLTTTEIADELVGGFLSAGPERLTAAAALGIPQVVSVGATDMVNFYAPATVPSRFADRTFHIHDPQVTLMRTTPAENALIGADIGRKLAGARGPVAVLLPTQGVSALDKAGQPFDDPVARQALFQGIRAHAGSVEVITHDHHINDREFARAAAHKLLVLMAARGKEETS